MGCCRKRYPWELRYIPVPYPIVPNYPASFPAVFMRGKELDCWFAGVLFERHIDGLVFQYDSGLTLNIRGLDTDLVNQVEFTRADNTDGAIAYTPEIIDPLASEVDPEAEDGEPTADPAPDDGTGDDTGDTGDNTGDDTGDETQTEEPTEEPAETEETERKPEELKYLSVAIPDALLTKPGTVIAYCTYKHESEYRTVKAIYITVHERQAVKAEEPSDETNDCGCSDEIAALQETIAALTERVQALENGEEP